MYNADGSLKTVGKGRYKGGNSGGGSTSLGFGDGYEARCISICDQLTVAFTSVAPVKTRWRHVSLAYDPSCGSRKVIVKSSFRSRHDSKENQKAQRPDSAFESGGRPAAGMKSKVWQCIVCFAEVFVAV